MDRPNVLAAVAEAIRTKSLFQLEHRTRNLIAVVRGIADDTTEQTGPGEGFRITLSSRLTALSRAQGLLSRAKVEPIALAAVACLELNAIGAGTADPRVTVAGPDMWLHNATVQPPAPHELATNARKYGALSHEAGRHRDLAGARRGRRGPHPP